MHQQNLRQLALAHQKLIPDATEYIGKSGTLSMIQHLGYVQIDTISVVERAHHHVLWNRVQDYQQDHLNHLVKDQQIFEYWAHAAAYLPMRDYRFALIQMNAVRRGESRYFNRGEPRLMTEIMAQITAEGPLKLRDLELRHRQVAGQGWNSSTGRRALEQLFMQGDLMICQRQGMEKIYDLTARCLPADLDLSEPDLQQYAQYLFDQTLRAHGIFSLKQLLHLKTGQSLQKAMRQIIDEQLQLGTITPIQQAKGQLLYVDTQALAHTLQPQVQLKILSPFDNVLIHRERLEQIFAMDYRLECYLPAEQRRFGYFCLPVLYADQLVGRMDCKAHRGEKTLQLCSFHLQDEAKSWLDQDQFYFLLMQELERFAAFNQCNVVDTTEIKFLQKWQS